MTFAVYFLIPKFGKWGGVRAGTLWLSFASLVFYGYWDIRYVPLLLGSICWNFAIGRLIENKPSKKKLLLTSGIIVNLLLLGYYKYTAFFIENLDAATGLSYDIPHIILPLGISFFTFTQTAYIIDAYRGETKGYSFIMRSITGVFASATALPSVFSFNPYPSKINNTVLQVINRNIHATKIYLVVQNC